MQLRALGPVALFLALGPPLGAVALAATAPRWLEPVETMGLAAVPWFLAVTVVCAGLSLLPTHASSLVAGLLFGPGLGSILALVGVTGASWIGYAAFRFFAGDRPLQLLSGRPRALAVHRALLEGGRRRTAGLIALVRLSPAMPFATTNFLMAAAGVHVREFLVGSVMGLAPRVVLVAVAGAGLAELDLERGSDVRLAVFGLLTTLLAVWVVGRIARAAVRGATSDVQLDAEP